MLHVFHVSFPVRFDLYLNQMSNMDKKVTGEDKSLEDVSLLKQKD